MRSIKLYANAANGKYSTHLGLVVIYVIEKKELFFRIEKSLNEKFPLLNVPLKIDGKNIENFRTFQENILKKTNITISRSEYTGNRQSDYKKNSRISIRYKP